MLATPDDEGYRAAHIPFTDNIAKEAGVSLAKTMVARGYKIDIARL